MYITIASYKGGVGKTITAVHIAAALSKKASTLLIDGDNNNSSINWNKRGGLSFDVCHEEHGPMLAGKYEHVVIDTEARPNKKTLTILAEGCDLLVIPVSPDALSLDATVLTARELAKLGATNYKILLTKVPPQRGRALGARNMFKEAKIPVFKESIGRYVAFEDATLEGVTVDEVSNKYALRAWKQYVQLTKEILKHGSSKKLRRNNGRQQRVANA